MPTQEQINGFQSGFLEALRSAIRLSVRTMPCHGMLHVYGAPLGDIRYYAYYTGPILEHIGPSVRKELVALWEELAHDAVCPVNPTARHISEAYSAHAAGLVSLTHNIWGDRLGAMSFSELTVLQGRR
jgi:hypothetical protein